MLALALTLALSAAAEPADFIDDVRPLFHVVTCQGDMPAQLDAKTIEAFCASQGKRYEHFRTDWAPKAGKFVGDHERLHIIYLTNFKCGPDSYIKHYIRAASRKPFLTLQFDEHQNDAGAMTRCEAYLDSKGFLRWWSQGGDDRLAGERDPSADECDPSAGELSGAPVGA